MHTHTHASAVLCTVSPTKINKEFYNIMGETGSSYTTVTKKMFSIN